MNGGSDHFDSLEHTPISEAVFSEQDFSNHPSFPLMESNLKLSNFSPTDLSSNNHTSEKAAILIDLQPQLGFDSQQEYDPHMTLQQSNWAESFNGMQEIEFNIHSQQQEQLHQHDLYQQQQYNLQCFNSTSCAEPTPELLNLLHLAGCSATTMLPGPSINIFSDMSMEQSIPASMGTVPFNQLNFSSEPPVFRELFQTLPHDFSIPGSRAGSCFDGMDARDPNEGLLQEEEGMHMENSVPNLRRGRAEAKGKQTDKQKRGEFNEKFGALSSLLPNPTKPDRASVVAGAIEYINELQRTVNELKMLVKKKKIQRERSRRLKIEDGMAPDTESSLLKPIEDGEHSFNEAMRSSWIIRKSKETVIDVRIIDDEVNIKLTQRRKTNCLLLVSKVLYELQMELLHATGGNIGDYNIFMFNTKISEGSSVLYAGAIAQKLIEVLERHHLLSL